MDGHQKIKLAFKIIGGILLAGGLAFAIVGFVDFFGAMDGTGAPKKFWCLFVGLPLIFFGIALLAVGFRREIMSYQEKEHAPVVNDAAKDMKPAVKTIASAVKEGLNGEEKTVCACGAENGKDSRFCKACGKPLVRVCKECGAENDADSAFCDQCGKKLE